VVRIAILGMGCAAGALAYQLARRGFDGELHLVDPRADFAAEQRWCSWGPLPDDLAPLVSASWPRWRIATERRDVVRGIPGRLYQHVYAPDYYRHVLAALRERPNVHLHLGVAARGVEESQGAPVVLTDAGALRVDLVFDSRPAAAPAGAARSSPPPVALRQTFVGQVVRTARPLFDPATATLMDFRVPPLEGLPFMYALPFAPDRALVESTAFAPCAVPDAEHHRRIAEYLARQGAGVYTIEAEERGDLLMTTAPFLARLGPRHYALGVAGGGLRPSSGYGFARMQRHAARVAAAVVRGAPIPARVSTPKYTFLDAVFLDALGQSWPLARESFVRLFDRVPPRALVRFMQDESTALDDLALVLALPTAPYARAALRRVGGLALSMTQRSA